MEERIVDLLSVVQVPHSGNPLTAFEGWLGIIDSENDGIEESCSRLTDTFFTKFASILQWALQRTLHPLHSEGDFEYLECIQATRWLYHCIDLHLSPDSSFLELMLSVSTSWLDSYFQHLHNLSQLQSLINMYTQSIRGNLLEIPPDRRLERMNQIQLTTNKLQTNLDLHLSRVGTILAESYSASSPSVRSDSRTYLATYWHRFVTSRTSSSQFQENTRAAGLAMTLRVLLRIVKGISQAQPSHRHLLLYTLVPLHQPDALVLWRDQTSLLDLYHEPLVQCIAVLLQKEPGWIDVTIEKLLAPDIWPRASGNTPKVVLMLHEIDTILGLVPEGATLSCFDALLHRLTVCISSDNSRLSERALQFWKNEKWKLLFWEHYETALPLLLKTTIRSELPWNPTVRKMTYHVLKELYDFDQERFGDACKTTGSAVGRRSGPVESKTAAAGRGTALPRVKSEARVNTTDFSLKAGMGNWKPPPQATTTTTTGTKHGMMPPPPRNKVPGRGKAPWANKNPPATITGVAPWAKSNSTSNPPVTVTGVAPWANQKPVNPPTTITGVAPWANKRSNPPPTVTGVAPWANQKSQPAGTRMADPVIVEEVPESTVEDSEHGSALASVLAYMDKLKPPAEREGASPWAREQMAETPTLLPSLKFHDLVFGHELGSGAFGHVKYARRISRSSTRSHWSEYAVKIISTSKIEELGYEASVQREICTLRLMSHPGIARLISSFRFRDGAYLVLEYASRGDLHSLLRQSGSLDNDSTQFVVGEIIAALSSIHELGFVYGDLKPENVLITETGHVKLTDFGACRPYSTEAKALIKLNIKNVLTNLRDGDWRVKENGKFEKEPKVSGWSEALEEEADASNMDAGEAEDDLRIEGTTAYLPPEVVLGTIPTPAADVWALGCVMYQCLTGRPPLLEDDEDATRHKIVSFANSQQVDSLFGGNHAKDVKEGARRLIRRLLKRSPVERPPVQQVATHDFFAGIDVFTLYQNDAHPLDAGKVAAVTDAKWARRQFSSIWAPQPKAYDISLSTTVLTGRVNGELSTAPIPEGAESSSFFSFVSSTPKVTST